MGREGSKKSSLHLYLFLYRPHQPEAFLVFVHYFGQVIAVAVYEAVYAVYYYLLPLFHRLELLLLLLLMLLVQYLYCLFVLLPLQLLYLVFMPPKRHLLLR